MFLNNIPPSPINLMTKQKIAPGFETKMEAAYGSYSSCKTGIAHGGKINKFDYYLFGINKTSGGHRKNAHGQLQN